MNERIKYVSFICFVFYFSLIKEENQRPKYNRLLVHPFIIQSETSNVNTSQYFSEILDNMLDNGTIYTMDIP